MTVNIFGLYPSIYRELPRLQALARLQIVGVLFIPYSNNKAADSLPLAESISGFHESSNPLDTKNGTRFSASADFLPYHAL